MDETIARVEAEIRHNGEILRQAQDDRHKAREAYRQEQKARIERAERIKAEIQNI